MQVRVPDELIERIDNLRPELVPREAYIRYLLETVVDDIELREKRNRARNRKRAKVKR